MMKKTYTGRIEFKANSDETGAFSAEFATLNVIDHDGDVTLPGAFRDGQETLIEAWNHGLSQLPVGKGVIHERDDKAIIEGRFFLDTQGGQEHYKVVKALGPLQEWSYTFQVEERKFGEFEGHNVQFLRALDVWGVAPVQRGAGIDTRTTSIKSTRDADVEPPELKAVSVGNDGDDTAGKGEGQTEGGDPRDTDLQARISLCELSIIMQKVRS